MRRLVVTDERQLLAEGERWTPGVGGATWALLGVVGVSVATVSADPFVIVAVVLLVTGLTCTRRFAWKRAWRLVVRMKWFYLSLLVFYGIWPSGSGGVAAGLGEAGVRILALVLVVLLVVWLTERFPRALLVRSLGLLLRGPRGFPGSWGERFALRLFLALEYFESDRAAVEVRRGSLAGSRKARVQAVYDWLVERLERALAGGWDDTGLERTRDQTITPSMESAPTAAVIWLWAGVLMAWAAWWGL